MSEGSKPDTANQGSADGAADTSADVKQNSASANKAVSADQATSTAPAERPTEYGGQKGLEPTRYGDWEKNGRCTDF